MTDIAAALREAVAWFDEPDQVDAWELALAVEGTLRAALPAAEAVPALVETLRFIAEVTKPEPRGIFSDEDVLVVVREQAQRALATYDAAGKSAAPDEANETPA